MNSLGFSNSKASSNGIHLHMVGTQRSDAGRRYGRADVDGRPLSACTCRARGVHNNNTAEGAGGGPWPASTTDGTVSDRNAAGPKINTNCGRRRRCPRPRQVLAPAEAVRRVRGVRGECARDPMFVAPGRDRYAVSTAARCGGLPRRGAARPRRRRLRRRRRHVSRRRRRRNRSARLLLSLPPSIPISPHPLLTPTTVVFTLPCLTGGIRPWCSGDAAVITRLPRVTRPMRAHSRPGIISPRRSRSSDAMPPPTNPFHYVRHILVLHLIPAPRFFSRHALTQVEAKHFHLPL